jgi:copper-binding protein NosD
MLNNKIFAVLGLMSGLLVFSANVQAKTVSVQCRATRTYPNTISAALKLLDPNGPNTLNIFGVCNENVVINGFNRLALAGKHGASVTDASGGAAQTIQVIDSTDVVFRQLTIDGGLIGVQCDDFSVCRFDGDQLINGRDGGIQITQSRAEISGTTIRNTGNGVTSLGASSIRIVGGVTLENNGNGIVVDGGSSIEVFGAAILNSQFAGIEVAEHAYLSLSATTISGNRNGIELVRHSSVHLGPGNAITANRDYGIFLFDLSFANFDPGNNVTGNNRNGAGALDVACFAQYTATRGVFINTGGATTNCAEN